MWPLIGGAATAAVAAVLYNAGVVLQACEARATDGDQAWRPRLVTGLVRRRRWLLGTALGLLGWPVHAVALLWAPLSVVQPALAFGLVALLIAGARRLHERVTRSEAVAVVTIVAGVAALAVVAPAPRWSAPSATVLALVLGLVGAGVLVCWLLAWRRRAGSRAAALVAGLCFAWSGLATQLVTDALHHGQLPAAALWAAACGAAGLLGLVAEMTALQRAAATRVAPLEFSVQVVVPVVLGPLIGTGALARGALGIAIGVAGLVLVTGAAVLLLVRSPAVGVAIDDDVASSRETGSDANPRRRSDPTSRRIAAASSPLTTRISPGRGLP
jgi:drug/metabolite transporter (DMT)-like permease